MSYNNIDDNLKEQNRWVLYSNEDRDGKPTKVPRQCKGTKARSNTSSTWTNYEDVIDHAQLKQFDGIGFVLGEGYIGIDLDHCYDPDTEEFIDPVFGHFIDKIGGYKEFSPSGDGIHIILKCDLEGSETLKKIKKSFGKNSTKTGFKIFLKGKESDVALEFYWKNRFFTMTGNTLPESNEMEVEVDSLKEGLLEIGSHFNVLVKEKSEKKLVGGSKPVSFTDQELIDRACKANNGQRFSDLYSGLWESYTNDGSQNGADMAFMNLLAFWSGKNRGQMERIFKSSGLWPEERENKKGQSYIETTLDRAIADCDQIYDQDTFKRDKREQHKLLSEKLEVDSNVIFINEKDPEMGVTNKQPKILYQEVINKLAAENDKDYKIFMLGGGWSYLENNQLLNIRKKGEFRNILSEIGRWMVYDNDESIKNLSKVPDHILESIPDRSDRLDLFPEIKRLIKFPILKKNGDIVTKKGYDKETGLYILEDQDVEIDKSEQGLKDAIQILQEPFRHFQFVDEEDHANMWAYFFTILYRYRIKGNIPFFGFNAPNPGVGKSLLLKSLYWIIEDREPTPMKWPQKAFDPDESLEDIVSGTIAKGCSFGYFDNVQEGTDIKSNFLAMYGTAGNFSRRFRYESVPRTLDTEMIIAFTGNNISFGADLTRRALIIELTVDTDTPENRVLPDLEAEVDANRNTLLSAAMTVLWHWQKEGSPKSNQKKGSFEKWSAIIGGIIEFMGIDGFTSRITKIDPQEEAFRQFIAQIWQWKGKSAWMAKEVRCLAFGSTEDYDDSLLDVLDHVPEDGLLEEYFSQDPKKRNSALGWALKKRSNRVFKVSEDTLVRLVPLKSANPRKYELHFVEPDQVSQEDMEDLDDLPF